MSGKTKIEWSQKSWNYVRGCRRISAGCEHCYAEAIAARFSGEGFPYAGLARRTPSGPRWTGELRFVREALCEPLRWREPSLVFVNSMSDLFHESFVEHDADPFHPLGQAIRLGFAVMAAAKQHTFQILTKRADQMRRWFEAIEREAAERSQSVPDLLWSDVLDAIDDGVIPGRFAGRFSKPPEAWPLPNVWLGVSVEDQARAEERIPLLLETPAAVRWISAEPLLGELDLSPWIARSVPVTDDALDAPDGAEVDGMARVGSSWERIAGLDWIVVGGESGPGARPMEFGWTRSLVNQCARADVPIFVKQLGDAYSDPINGIAGRFLDIPGVRDGMVPAPRRLGSKGNEVDTWPEVLRVRQWPEVRR